MEEIISKLKKLVSTSDKIVAFTGAGFSAESGISTFRGAGGLWSKYDPSIYADINYFIKDPSYYWSFIRDERYPTLKKAKPNDGHYALVELERYGKLYRVITQNIDGFHQIAGSSDVIELHGNSRNVNCMNCEKNYNMDDVFKKLEKDIPPRCSCGGVLKPATVLFGEPLPQYALEMAKLASKNCDMFLVLGSSLVVYPAASLPRIAKKNGAKLVIINIDPTPLDHIADIVINDSASKVLTAVINGGLNE
ncbi:MAG: NAD-dependent deacylase [Thermoplasmatales archaeon]|nr:MAG: NAD-dependent deacylase [Thermoplasmatales archaeon]